MWITEKQAQLDACTCEGDNQGNEEQLYNRQLYNGREVQVPAGRLYHKHNVIFTNKKSCPAHGHLAYAE